MSGVRLSRQYLTGMLAANRGRILFSSSDAAVHVTPSQLHYAVTETALLALSRSLAELTRGTEVTVNTVLPGPTATEGIDIVIDGVAGQTGMSREEIVGHLFATDQIRPPWRPRTHAASIPSGGWHYRSLSARS